MTSCRVGFCPAFFMRSTKVNATASPYSTLPSIGSDGMYLSWICWNSEIHGSLELVTPGRYPPLPTPSTNPPPPAPLVQFCITPAPLVPPTPPLLSPHPA